MRGEEVEKLDGQARALAEQIGRWQRRDFRVQLTRHKQQLDAVERWLVEGSESDDDIRLRNSVEWVRQGKTKLYVVTETADSDYRAKGAALAGPDDCQGRRILPPPGSRRYRGGNGDRRVPHLRPRNAADPNVVVHGKGAGGWNGPGYIVVNEAGTHDRDQFFVTLRHEVQHDADRHRGDELSEGIRTAGTRNDLEFQTTLRRYKTEYRAHYYQGGTPDFPLPGGQQPARNRQWDSRQLAIFEHVRKSYPTINAAVGGGRQEDFLKAAHAYQNPDREGFNKYNSVRIDDLYLALREVPKGTSSATHPAVVAVLKAARNLDKSDVAYIRAGQGLDEDESREEATMLRAMLSERLGGDARRAFKYELDRVINVFASPPRGRSA
jgi:hypothetical protein